MRHVEFFFFWKWANTPLLHGQGAKQNLNRLALIVFANLIDDYRVSRDVMPFNLGIEQG